MLFIEKQDLFPDFKNIFLKKMKGGDEYDRIQTGKRPYFLSYRATRSNIHLPGR
jgi:hypothetical protein